MIQTDVTFTATMQKSPRPGGWVYVVWPESAEFFGTHGVVKIAGTINDQPFKATFMAMGDGVQMLPIKAETRQQIGKDVGDSVSIHLTERL